MDEVFVRRNDNFYTKYIRSSNINSITNCRIIPLTVHNATFLNIFDMYTKITFEERMRASNIEFYTHIIKKDHLLIYNVHFQFLNSIKKLFEEIVNSISYLNDLENDLNNKLFETAMRRALERTQRANQDIKSQAIKKCYAEAGIDFISLYGETSSYNQITIDSFFNWISSTKKEGRLKKIIFYIGSRISRDNEHLLSPYVSKNQNLIEKRSENILPAKNKKISYNINHSYSIFVNLLSVNSLNITDKDFSLLNLYIGGNSTSILFKQLREQHQLVYDVSSVGNANTGEIVIFSKVKNGLLNQVIEKVSNELEKINNGLWDKNTIDAAENYFRLNSLIIKDRPLALTRAYINYLTNNHGNIIQKSNNDFSIRSSFKVENNVQLCLYGGLHAKT
ncbi:insulinase family protein [Bacillus chungangensis]|uniref:Peptidase M16 C-terminal domain-containing protein n=1 Tax=Bacillus chungangensis TaxID=587633 RepID=A0ABT9WVU8_9BACI|nr:insulinase family protein [Bacillus chungangensis]MDQ0177301.1 hypothetical protein [Bacillus chungangensis]